METIANIQKRYYSKIAPLDLELLLSSVINKSREFVLSHPEYKLSKYQLLSIKHKIAKRIKGEPMAYILGHKEFYGLDFKVNKNTLIPRPETELMVELGLEEVRKLVRKRLRTISLVDIGTGSGNVIISILKELKNSQFPFTRWRTNSQFIGIDISKKALAVARKNARIHKVHKKIKFTWGDLLKSISKSYKLKTKSWIILANLPYLDTGWKNLLKSTETKGLKYEPSIALYAGKDGLDAYRKLAKQIKDISGSKITLFCEIGHLQKSGIKKIFYFAKKIDFHKDLSGKWRIAQIKI